MSGGVYTGAGHDESTCTCPDHVTLGAAALVLHEQGIGCNWHQTQYRNRSHYEPVSGSEYVVTEVHDAGPFLHDGWHHDGDHEAVVVALRGTVLLGAE